MVVERESRERAHTASRYHESSSGSCDIRLCKMTSLTDRRVLARRRGSSVWWSRVQLVLAGTLEPPPDHPPAYREIVSE